MLRTKAAYPSSGGWSGLGEQIVACSPLLDMSDITLVAWNWIQWEYLHHGKQQTYSPKELASLLVESQLLNIYQHNIVPNQFWTISMWMCSWHFNLHMSKTKLTISPVQVCAPCIHFLINSTTNDLLTQTKTLEFLTLPLLHSHI